MSLNEVVILPKRNVGSYLKGCEKQTIKTNLFKVEFQEKALITIYSLTLDPQIPKDSTKLSLIVQSVQHQLSQQIGNYLVSGNTIYGCQPIKNKGKETAVKIDAHLGMEKYALTLKPVRVVDLANLSSTKEGDTFLPLNFFNNLMKKFFASMKFTSIGKCGKYFNPKSRKVLNNTGIILFNGYETKFNITENGLYLQVESMVRIIQNRTVLDEIDGIYASNSHLSKDEKRQAVKNELIGKTVMANYGNSRIWIIKQVIFDFDLETSKAVPETNISFIEYYEKSYNIKIKKKKQPVLKAVMNGNRYKKTEKQFILVPELLLISGLPDDFDEKKRRDISEFTIINPEEKLHRIQSLISAFNSENENFCPNSVSKNLGVKFSETTETVEAIMLPAPILQLGGGQSVQKPKVASFQLFNKEIYEHSIPVNVVVFIPSDYDFTPVEKLFVSTCRNLCIKNNLNLVRVNYQDSKKALVEIQKHIQDKQGRFDDYDLNWFVLPPNMKSYYKNIKTLSLKEENPKVTQVALTTTLAKKGFAAILTKILLQISSKVGNVPWAPKIPAAIPHKTMLVGISSCKEAKNIIVGYCCTINREMSKFHSNYDYQPMTSNFNPKMGDIIADCLASYSKANSTLPEEIIIIKTDVSDGEKDNISFSEVNQVKDKLKSMTGYHPKLTFMTANKSSKQKFFIQGQKISNPGYGTLVNSKVVSKDYDFYLIAQHCNRGTVKPVHFKVLFSDSKIEEGVLQELIYCQSFNYMNWSGSVRVPSVLQYSNKLCNFVADHISRAPETEQLNELLYYI